MKILASIYNGWAKLESYLTKILIGIITLLTFGSAISRVIGFPMPWSLELILMFFAWFAFLAASQATRRKTHMGVDILTMFLPRRVNKVIEIFNNILIIGFLAVLSYSALMLSIKNAFRTISSLGISYSFVTSAAFVGGSLMFISEIIHIVCRITELGREIASTDQTEQGGHA